MRKDYLLLISFSFIALCIIGAIASLIVGLVVAFPAPFLITAGLCVAAIAFLPFIGFYLL